MHRHAICHIEWSSTDLERTRKFLSGLFNWKFDSWGDKYILFKPLSGVGGGIQKVERVTPGQSPVVYVEVEEIKPYLDKAIQLGGKVAVGETDIPHTGHVAQIMDPDGNIVGVFKPHSEPGKPWSV